MSVSPAPETTAAPVAWRGLAWAALPPLLVLALRALMFTAMGTDAVKAAQAFADGAAALQPLGRFLLPDQLQAKHLYRSAP